VAAGDQERQAEADEHRAEQDGVLGARTNATTCPTAPTTIIHW
jgi:hypothetical protein